MSPALPPFLDRVIGARSEDPELALRELVINASAAGLFVLGVLWGLADVLTHAFGGTLGDDLPLRAVSYASVGVGLGICLSVYGLSRRGRIKLAGYLLISALVAYTTILVGRGGIEIPDVVLFFLAIALAGLLTGGQGSLVTATAAWLLYAGIGLLQALELHPVALKWPLLPSILSLGLVLYLTALLNWIAHRHLSLALQEARRRSQELDAARQEQASLVQDLQTQTKQQAHLLQTVEALSAPVIAIHDEIIALPLVGPLDSDRAESVRQALLQGVARHRARIALIDLTGMVQIDQESLRHLETMVQAGRLLGADVVLVGIRAEAASGMIALGTDLRHIPTHRDLQSGIEWALAQAGKRIVADDGGHAGRLAGGIEKR